MAKAKPKATSDTLPEGVVKVTFLANVTVHDANGAVEQSFKDGETAQLPRASAERWIRRGKAVAE